MSRKVPLVVSSMPFFTRMELYYYVCTDQTEKANGLLSDSVRRLIPVLLKEIETEDNKI